MTDSKVWGCPDCDSTYSTATEAFACTMAHDREEWARISREYDSTGTVRATKVA